MKDFEKKLARLEELSESIKDPNLPLDEAMKIFEEGISISKQLTAELEKVEGKVQKLLNGPDVQKAEDAKLGLFDVGG